MSARDFKVLKYSIESYCSLNKNNEVQDYIIYKLLILNIYHRK